MSSLRGTDSWEMTQRAHSLMSLLNCSAMPPCFAKWISIGDLLSHSILGSSFSSRSVGGSLLGTRFGYGASGLTWYFSSAVARVVSALSGIGGDVRPKTPVLVTSFFAGHCCYWYELLLMAYLLTVPFLSFWLFWPCTLLSFAIDQGVGWKFHRPTHPSPRTSHLGWN